MSDEIETCPTCGGVLKKRGTRTVCPRCLLAGTVEASASEISANHPPVRIDAPSVEELADSFPDLELIRLVGVGGMGIVYEAQQKALERKVALKLLRLDSVNPEFAERFQREAKTLAKLSHPNIVSIFDQGERDGWVFILMEYVEGSDLSRLMEAGALTPEQSLEIAEVLCEALSYAHEQGVIHRDIKPANILLDREGTVKIADFGLAKFAVGQGQDFSLTSGGSSMGTPLYMAPEQRKSSADADPRADLYSAGVVLYEMLTGELPVGRVRPPSESGSAPAALDEVVLKAIEPDPARRFGSALKMREALRDAQEASAKPSRRLPLAATITSAAIVAGVAFAAWPKNDDHAAAAGAGTPPAVPPSPSELREVKSDSSAAILLTAEEPSEDGMFASIIEAGADIVAVGYCKTRPLRPSSDSAPGEVYVYQIGADKIASPPQILRAAQPATGDHFGRYVAVSPRGDTIAVASSETGPGEINGEPVSGCVTIFDRVRGGENRWQRAATFFVGESFGTGRYAMRVTASEGLIALGAPNFNDLGAARYFERTDGRWQQLPDLVAGKEEADGGFGLTSALHHSGQWLAVSSGSHDLTPEGHQGKFVVFRREQNGDWIRAGQFLDTEPNVMELFGTELRSSADTLAANIPFDHLDGVVGAGGIAIFEFDPSAAAGWRRTTTLRAPLPSPQRVGFGSRYDMADGWLAAMTIQSSKTEDAHSVIYMARRAEGEEGWRFVGKISSSPDEEAWLGRVALGDHFVACAHPLAEIGGAANAGKVYVFPKALFTAGSDPAKE